MISISIALITVAMCASVRIQLYASLTSVSLYHAMIQFFYLHHEEHGSKRGCGILGVECFLSFYCSFSLSGRD
ncbi:hypothetical protein L211DRAFT_267637 [Terfezia boudieri ATCC MYA-4762]|uniref:Secreted protein n=1 Tax=Terfezia boudieri ATCC MYA-4762 TaxID=1051890 RepID=A0A3N4LKU3_9PEZI|nr:hypothetical protein L211DRAFT_267637 [Terfezia boudieri ATCC MYA-4762]